MQAHNILDKFKVVNDGLFNSLCNNMLMQADKSTLAHDMLYSSIARELIYNNSVQKQESAGHKDSSANIINKASINDVTNDNLLNDGIIYFAKKAIKIEKVFSKHQKDIACMLSNISYDDIDSKFNKLKEVNDQLNLLLNALGKTIFNKQIVKEQIIFNAKVLINVKKYTLIVDNKYVCISEICEYLSDNIDDIHSNIKNKINNELITLLKIIRKRIFISIKRMYAHAKNKKASDVNKKIDTTNGVDK